MTYVLLTATAIFSLLFAADFALSGVHCPFQFRMPNGSLCKQFHSNNGERIFSECSYGREYRNPIIFSPVEVCSE